MNKMSEKNIKKYNRWRRWMWTMKMNIDEDEYKWWKWEEECGWM